MNGSFALYRLPGDDKCTLLRQLNGMPKALSSCRGLTGMEGFVMAPFAVSGQNPLYVLEPDVAEVVQTEDIKHFTSCRLKSLYSDAERACYGKDFNVFHRSLRNGCFHKLVLSRRHDVESESYISPETLFNRACSMYPHMFVALVSMPQTGTWLMATPEILLEGEGCNWHTMALAGTMKLDEIMPENREEAHCGTPDTCGGWSKKNIEEQQIVRQYIKDCLSDYSDNIVEEGPYTSQAGGVVHLRSDFNFTMRGNGHIGELADRLHPTPAVCGLPKKEAQSFILDNEHSTRSFYSGFAGPLSVHADSHLFVTLRCMQINGSRYSLYAGGGLLADSMEQQEWDETVSKLATMRALFEGR